MASVNFILISSIDTESRMDGGTNAENLQPKIHIKENGYKVKNSSRNNPNSNPINTRSARGL